MSSEDAVRRHLLRKLRSYDPDAAERLSDDFNAEDLKQRLRSTNYWATGWRKWIWIITIAVSLFMMVSPVASEEIGAELVMSGVAILMGVVAVANRWRQKRAIYETLAVLADPGYEPEGQLLGF